MHFSILFIFINLIPATSFILPLTFTKFWMKLNSFFPLLSLQMRYSSSPWVEIAIAMMFPLLSQSTGMIIPFSVTKPFFFLIGNTSLMSLAFRLGVLHKSCQLSLCNGSWKMKWVGHIYIKKNPCCELKSKKRNPLFRYHNFRNYQFLIFLSFLLFHLISFS